MQLPQRRPNATREIEHGGHIFTVTVGFDLAGRPREVFADGMKVGTGLGHIIADACVWASILLQTGVSPAHLGKSLGRVPVVTGQPGTTAPASALGAIAEAVQAECHAGAGVGYGIPQASLATFKESTHD